MTELLPSLQAEEIRRGLVDYLTTTFALADAEPRRALGEFLQHPEDGIFKGPYVRLRAPFQAAKTGWQDHLDWTPPFAPYRHQAAAYARLTTKDIGPEKPRPLPTIVTTGTGSGKTEAFLHPILDHVLRARSRGERGMKALILYPMNALADDQAARLTKLITEDPKLSKVTAALYTGDANEGQPGQGRTKVTADGLITNRSIIRDDPPDILLTNYKMLDQLLLRSDDQPLWAKSARSLTYLVLDEFHTYDGAQGTDVAMLLRRLGLALKDHVPQDDPDRGLYDDRALGRVTPVATSATLGDGGDPGAMLAFAAQVFGEPFGSDAAITESRIPIDDLTLATREALDGRTPRSLGAMVSTAVAELAALRDRREDGAAILTGVVDLLYGESRPGDITEADLLLAHPDVRQLIDAAADSTHIDELARLVLSPTAIADSSATARGAIAAILAALSHVRLEDRDAVSVEVTMWVREVTRVDRLATSEALFSWGDDGTLTSPDVTQTSVALPAVYCRSCGRSGWGVGLTATGRDLIDKDDVIRRDHLLGRGRFRALLHAPGEAALAEERSDEALPDLRWLHVPQRTILTRRPAVDDPDLLEGRVLPVRMLDGDSEEIEQRSRRDECPSCGANDSIRFLGSAIATLLSVTLSTLFGDRHLDSREKRALVFTDSVQDAAHRAGFVDHRSHAMSLRAALRGALSGPTDLKTWVDEVVRQAADDGFARYRLVPTALLTHEVFAPYWQDEASPTQRAKGRTAVGRRLLFDAELEVGLQASFGRTLEATGSIGVHVDAGPERVLIGMARRALGEEDEQLLPGDLAAIGDLQLVQWVRGTLEHLRSDGAIDHEWLDKYVRNDGARVWIWGKRRRDQGAPAFPSGRSAPAFPIVGAAVNAKSAFVRVTSPQSWYARWAQRCLGVSAGHGAALAALLLAVLAQRDVLSETATDSGGKAYGIPVDRVVVTPLTEDTGALDLLVCDTCRSPVPVAPEVLRQLADGPCVAVRCRGRLVATRRDSQSFYRDLFAAADMRRVDAREHTSLLSGEERRSIEAGFKRSDQHPGDPNVLVATPTLEMGIDIGDLTTVMLASLPDSVAKYLQRVGRAGRLTGSSLALAYVTGRGDQLPRLGDPASMINGAVRPPATYLDAEEILRRQFLASVIDRMVRTGYAHMPRTSGDVLSSADPGSLLGDVIAEIGDRGAKLLRRFTDSFTDAGTPGLTALAAWATPTRTETAGTGEDETEPDTFETTIYRAVREHTRDVEDLRRQRKEIEDAIPALREAAEHSAATDDDKRALRSAIGASRLMKRVLQDLTGETWISGLELRGLLPNYSLLDDSVELDAQVTWVDPDTQQFESEPLVIDRGSSRALTEFAPGTHFYAHGLKIPVEGIEIARDGEDVSTLVACDQCGYVADLGTEGQEPAPKVCPRCGGTGIADTGQRFESVRLKRVFSDVRGDDAQIGDDSDERQQRRFEVVTAVDFDPSRCDRQWSVETIGLGVAHYRRLPVRWFNVGASTGAPTTARLAGVDVSGQMFRVCTACGKLDRDAGVSTPREHRAWCPHRNDPDENTRLLALSRELVTQGVALSLPEVISSDLHSTDSLSAALQLGLRETMGGAPDHLRVVVVPQPTGKDGQVRTALFLHDTVPGGTGYLTELADPARLWGILVRAAQVLEACPCQDEGRASCHRCLLPFVLRADQAHRIDALRALERLLGIGDETTVADLEVGIPTWQVSNDAVTPGSHESPLEQRFRTVMEERLKKIASVSSQPTVGGKELIIRAGDDRVWRLRPQILVHGSKPDFVLEANGGVPPVAIFTDGWAFHASPHHNRLADDAAKREKLRAEGYLVVSVTHDDINVGQTPDWWNDRMIGILMQMPAGQPGAGISREAAAEHKEGPLAQLGGLIARPADDARVRLGNALGLLLGVHASRGGRFALAPEEDLLAVACTIMAEGTHEGAGTDDVMSYCRPHLAFLARLRANQPVETVLVLDDSDMAVEQPDHADAWREWLRLSNLIGQSDVPSRIVTRSQIGEPGPTTGSGGSPGRLGGGGSSSGDTVAEIWPGVALEDLDEEVADLARLLTSRGVEVPALGEELDGGVVAELSWAEQRVAVVYDEMPTEEITVLEQAGWTVLRVEADAESVADGVMTAMTPDGEE